MHISTVNIFKVVTDKTRITIVIRYEVACALPIGMYGFDAGTFLEVIAKVMYISIANISDSDRYGNHCYLPTNRKCHIMVFRSAYLRLLLAHSKGQGCAYVDCEYL